MERAGKKYYKKRFRKSFRKAKKRYARKIPQAIKSWTGTVAVRKHQLDIPIALGFANGSNVLTPSIATSPGVYASFETDIFYWLTHSTLFQEMGVAYGYYQITGVKLMYQRMNVEGFTGIGGAGIVTLPPLAFFPTLTQSNAAIYIYEYDNAYKVQIINEDSKPTGKYYKFPSVQCPYAVDNLTNNVWVGDKIWMVSNINQNGPLKLGMGYPTTGLLNANSTSTGYVQIGNLRVTVYMRWCMPVGAFV